MCDIIPWIAWPRTTAEVYRRGPQTSVIFLSLRPEIFSMQIKHDHVGGFSHFYQICVILVGHVIRDCGSHPIDHPCGIMKPPTHTRKHANANPLLMWLICQKSRLAHALQNNGTSVYTEQLLYIRNWCCGTNWNKHKKLGLMEYVAICKKLAWQTFSTGQVWGVSSIIQMQIGLGWVIHCPVL